MGSKESILHKAGFAVVCLMTALIIFISLYKPFYMAGVSDLFYLSMDILGSVVCSMLYYGRLSKESSAKSGSTLFFMVLFINVLTFFFDSMMWLMSGVKDKWFMNTAVCVMFYAGADILIYLFWKYLCSVLKVDRQKYHTLAVLQKVMLCLAIIMCLVNFFTPFMFGVDESGIYHRAFGYSFGSFYILANFCILIAMVFKSGIEIWRKVFVVVPALVSILGFAVLWNVPKFSVSYTMSIVAVIITNCILYDDRLRMKELLIRVFSTLLLCAMLIYGPIIYRISLEKTIDEGYSAAERAYAVVRELLDETGIDRLCDPDNTELYQNTRQTLRVICQSFGLQNLYVETIDQKEMTRAFIIAVAASDEEDLVIQESLGWPGASVWGEESFLTEPELLVLNGQFTDLYSEQDNEYGHNLDWFFPYMDDGGNLAAIVGCDIDAGRNQTEIIKKSITDIAPSILLFFITMIVLNQAIGLTFLRPFYTIIHNMQNFFVEGKRKYVSYNSRSSYEIWFLDKSIDFMMSDIDEYEEVQAREIKEKQRISTEFELASRIQFQSLPVVFPPFPGRTDFDIYASMNPAKEVGGDFYDFFFAAPDIFAMVMADVSGKGVPAALFMMRSKTVIRAVAEQIHSPTEIIEKANLTLCDGNDKKMFVTIWLGIIDLKTGIMRCANAGHEYPYIKRAGGSYELYKDPHCPILGLKKTIRPKEYELKLEAGDSIFVYTDGIPEAINKNDEYYGFERLSNALNNNRDESMKTIIDAVAGDVTSYSGEAGQFDDITMLGFKYNGFMFSPDI